MLAESKVGPSGSCCKVVFGAESNACVRAGIYCSFTAQSKSRAGSVSLSTKLLMLAGLPG